MRSITLWIYRSPNQAFSDAFKETNSPFGFCTFDWFHLLQSDTELETSDVMKLTSTPSTPLAILLANASAPAVTP